MKRRGDMSSIYAQQLPPVAVAMTTENDEEEGKREVALHQVFSRIPEVVTMTFPIFFKIEQKTVLSGEPRSKWKAPKALIAVCN